MVISVAVVLALLCTYGLVRTVRAVAEARRGSPGDPARALLTLACRRLPADRVDWGRAMIAELDNLDHAAARWRFALGGVRAATLARLTGRGTGHPGVTMLMLGILACAGLVVTALVAYPALRADRKIPLFLAAMVVILAGYAGLARARARDMSAESAAARRYGLIGGSILAIAWVVAATAWWHLHSAPFVLAVLAPIAAGGFVARFHGRRAGIASVVWAGLTAGLAVFITLAIDAFATAAGPYDASQLAEYAHSDSTTIAAYWMGEDLAVSLALLLLIPCLTVVAGALGAAMTPPRRPEAT
ncbi:MAG TPA: hypothetical protein VGP26_19865 [Actinophytocola sp.]|jgi:hypothetical protein|nr:hypothetical protein [Actinophytocola sp.]